MEREPEKKKSLRQDQRLLSNYCNQNRPIKEKRSIAFKEINESSYLNPDCNGGQWMIPSFLWDHVDMVVIKLERKG